MPDVTQPADVEWMHRFYHNLHTVLIQAKGAMAADFKRAVYERRKPDGLRYRGPRRWTCSGLVPVTYFIMPLWPQRRAG